MERFTLIQNKGFQKNKPIEIFEEDDEEKY